METRVEIKEKKTVDDYFPCLFANGSKTVIILADSRTSEKTFSGMVIHTEKTSSKTSPLGIYSTGWTYDQYKRLPKGSELTLHITQENG